MDNIPLISAILSDKLNSEGLIITWSTATQIAYCLCINHPDIQPRTLIKAIDVAFEGKHFIGLPVEVKYRYKRYTEVIDTIYRRLANQA